LGETLHTIHSLLRYLVLLAGVAVVITALMGWRRAEGRGAGPERTAMAAFVGLLDLQVLAGLLLLAAWAYYPALIGHIAMMVLAAAAAHIGSILARRRGPERSGSPIRLATAVVVLVLIVGGIMAIQRPVL
jgi:hypothetical protein